MLDWFENNQTPTLLADGLILRAPQSKDYEQWRAVRLESRSFLKPFEPRWTESDLSRQIFRNRLRRSRRESARRSEFTFFTFVGEGREQRLVGGATLSNVRRRVSQHVTLGYWMGVNDARRGLMTRAVSRLLPFVFEDQKLHRMHAACLPHNVASRRVLEKNNFLEEGYAPGYLQIDGAWRDHVLYGLTKERFDASYVGV